jgi:hypothetical protein
MLLALILMNIFRGWAYRLHARIFGVTEEDVRRSIYLLMIQYKAAIILFCLVPYLVLRII